jgi:hypothetical protein
MQKSCTNNYCLYELFNSCSANLIGICIDLFPQSPSQTSCYLLGDG